MSGNNLPSREGAYFEKLYEANPDPWNFSGSAYEQRKYAATIEILGGRYFTRGLEAGCSIGVLTKRLAKICAGLLAVDIASQPLSQAMARCAADKHVTFEQMQIPQTWPAGPFDLIVFSEVLYFLDVAGIQRTAALADTSLAPGGILLLVNYTKAIPEPCSGEQAAAAFIRHASPSSRLVKQLNGESYIIHMLEKSGPIQRRAI